MDFSVCGRWSCRIVGCIGYGSHTILRVPSDDVVDSMRNDIHGSLFFLIIIIQLSNISTIWLMRQKQVFCWQFHCKISHFTSRSSSFVTHLATGMHIYRAAELIKRRVFSWNSIRCENACWFRDVMYRYISIEKRSLRCTKFAMIENPSIQPLGMNIQSRSRLKLNRIETKRGNPFTRTQHN